MHLHTHTEHTQSFCVLRALHKTIGAQRLGQGPAADSVSLGAGHKKRMFFNLSFHGYLFGMKITSLPLLLSALDFYIILILNIIKIKCCCWGFGNLQYKKMSNIALPLCIDVVEGVRRLADPTSTAKPGPEHTCWFLCFVSTRHRHNAFPSLGVCKLQCQSEHF